MKQEDIGNKIKEIRIKNNLSQKEFGDIFNVTYQAVSKWENGKTIPDLMILQEISNKYNIPIDELLGNKKKNNKIIIYVIIGLVIILSYIFLIIINDKDFEFKTLSSSCKNFTVTGSLAYNNSKSSIYISHIDYCGSDDNTIYNNISCSLYENNDDTIKKISSCEDKKNINLEEFLKNVSFNIDNYKNMCKNYNKDSLYLEIDANNNGIITTYKIPLELDDNC